MNILEELETSLWDGKLWDMAMKTPNPVESYMESRGGLDNEPPPDIDSLPNKDWLRA